MTIRTTARVTSRTRSSCRTVWKGSASTARMTPRPDSGTAWRRSGGHEGETIEPHPFTDDLGTAPFLGAAVTTPMPMHHHLPSGARVRLRLPVRADTDSLRALVGDEAAERLLHFDPRCRAVLCALDFEEVVGVGSV